MNGGWWRRSGKRLVASMTLALLFLAPGGAWGVESLEFKPGFNLFKMQQDVQLGKENAEQFDKELPLVTDPQVLRYINDLDGGWLHWRPITIQNTPGHSKS